GVGAHRPRGSAAQPRRTRHPARPDRGLLRPRRQQVPSRSVPAQARGRAAGRATMTPRRSLLGWFTASGRLHNRCAAVVAERDAARSYALFQKVARRFAGKTEKYAALWLPFLTSMLGSLAARGLTDADLRLLEETGARVAGTAGSEVGLAQIWSPIVAAWDA